jgi:RNA polymerase sigma-70 factor (ECF subfamily)
MQGEPMSRFQEEFAELFQRFLPRLFRYLNRLSGEPEVAADLAQDAFLRLYQRGSAPDRPEAWLVTVATNLFRNDRVTRARRARLLLANRPEGTFASEPASGASTTEERARARRVRTALARMPDRDRQILLLRAEGFSYREIAAATGLNEASIGTLLARAKRSFRDLYQEAADAP